MSDGWPHLEEELNGYVVCPLDVVSNLRYYRDLDPKLNMEVGMVSTVACVEQVQKCSQYTYSTAYRDCDRYITIITQVADNFVANKLQV